MLWKYLPLCWSCQLKVIYLIQVTAFIFYAILSHTKMPVFVNAFCVCLCIFQCVHMHPWMCELACEGADFKNNISFVTWIYTEGNNSKKRTRVVIFKPSGKVFNRWRMSSIMWNASNNKKHKYNWEGCKLSKATISWILLTLSWDVTK